jgi:hypothetical protein
MICIVNCCSHTWLGYMWIVWVIDLISYFRFENINCYQFRIVHICLSSQWTCLISFKTPLSSPHLQCVCVADSYRQSRSGAPRPGTVLNAVLEWLPCSLLAICSVWTVGVTNVSSGAANSPTSGVFTDIAIKCLSSSIPVSLTRWYNLLGALLQPLTGGKYLMP